MPATPVFIADLDILKAQLRLSAVDTGDAVDVIDSIMGEVRLGLYAELGSTRVTEILAIPFVDPAITDNHLTRLRANNTELLWVRALLMRRLPVLFVQSAGVARHTWNEEGIVREGTSGGDVRREVRELTRLYRLGLAALKGEDVGDLSVFVPVPDETPQRPGDSIRPALAGGHL